MNRLKQWVGYSAALVALWYVAPVLFALVMPMAADAQETQAMRIGAVSVTLPLDAAKTDNWTHTTPMRIERTNRYRSPSLYSTVTVSYVEFQESRSPEQRLVQYLHTFVENYGSIEHLVSIKENGRTGLNIKAQVNHDKSASRYTYVETRVFAESNKLLFVSIETEVNTSQPENFKTDELTKIFASMKVNQ